MNTRRLARLGCALAVTAATTLAAAAPASAATSTARAHGTDSLAALLAADGSRFDRDPDDFDILDRAVTAVLTAKPTSAVAVLADGSTPLTAFLPTDQAFRELAADLTGHTYRNERRVFTVLAAELGVDTIESVLLYHVVPGATITYGQARQADEAVLTTALAGSTVQVNVRRSGLVALRDADRDAANAVVVARNLNRGNVQIAHGVSEVLRPVDL